MGFGKIRGVMGPGELGVIASVRNTLSTTGRQIGAWVRQATKTRLTVLGLAVGIFAIGCSQGTYPLDIFYEMHYQQTFKSHEPPRMAGVENAVPVNWVPVPKSTSFNTGEHLFNVNCSMCHGTGAKGDGPVLAKMMKDYDYKPAVDPDLTSTGVVGMQEKGMMGFMISGVVVMPSFKKLLTPQEMDPIAEYIVTLQ